MSSLYRRWNGTQSSQVTFQSHTAEERGAGVELRQSGFFYESLPPYSLLSPGLADQNMLSFPKRRGFVHPRGQDKSTSQYTSQGSVQARHLYWSVPLLTLLKDKDTRATCLLARRSGCISTAWINLVCSPESLCELCFPTSKCWGAHCLSLSQGFCHATHLFHQTGDPEAERGSPSTGSRKT